MNWKEEGGGAMDKLRFILLQRISRSTFIVVVVKSFLVIQLKIVIMYCVKLDGQFVTVIY